MIHIWPTHIFVYIWAKKKTLKSSDKNGVRRRIVNIVKENTVQNLQILNKTILELLKVDDIFRDEIFKSRELLLSTPMSDQISNDIVTK